MKQFLSKYWPDIGIILALFLLAGLLIQPWLPLFSLKWLLWLHISILMIHQFEEYRFPGGLKKWMAEVRLKSKGLDTNLFDKTSLRVNMGSWGQLTLFALLGLAVPWPAFIYLFISLNNAIFHISYTVFTWRYSPGTLTSVLLLIPLVVFASYLGIKNEMITTWQFILTFLIGSAIHSYIIIVKHPQYRAEVKP